MLVLGKALCLLDDHLGNLDVAACCLIEGRRDYLALHHAAHLGNFLRALVDEEDHQGALRMVRGDALSDVLQEHGLSGLRGSDDKSALSLSDRGDEVDDPRGDVLLGAVAALKAEHLVRMERGQVLEEDLVAGALRGIVVDGVNLQEGEIALGLALRGTDLALDGVAGLQVELSDLGRRHVDVVRA